MTAISTATYADEAELSAKLEKVAIDGEVRALMINTWGDRFQHVDYPQQWLDNVIEVQPGESIQDAIDAAHEAGGGVVSLAAGEYVLQEPLTLKSRVTVAGQGQHQTKLIQGDYENGAAFNAEPKPTVTDVVIKDLAIKGGRKGKVNGIMMAGRNEDRHARIMLQNITLTDWSAQGVHMKRVDHIIMDRCTFQQNGSGGGLYHNVYFLYNKHILQSDCDMSYPVLGKGNKYTSVQYLLAQRVTIKDCLGNGVQADNEQAGYLFFHELHVSGCDRVALWFPCEAYYDKFNYTEDPKFAPQNIILNRCEIVDNTWGGMWRRVQGVHILRSTFDNKKIDLGLLKCEVTFRDSAFNKIETYTDVGQWPEDVELLW